MEKATSNPKVKAGRKKAKRTGQGSSVVNEEHKLSISAPTGSLLKRYDDFVVQNFLIEGRLIRYWRERWVTPEGKLTVASLPAGLHGHFGPELVRFILLQQH